MAYTLTKSRLLAHQQCPLRLWLEVHQPELASVSDVPDSRITAGQRAGEIARSLHPHGTLVSSHIMHQALTDTRQLLGIKPKPIFEAAFEAQGVLVRVDILNPVKNYWHLTEVKSASSVKAHYLPDTTIQTWVAKQAGLPISRIEVAHIDTSFVYPGDHQYDGLFKRVDITEAVEKAEANVPAWISSSQKTLTQKRPDLEPGAQCHTPYSCPFMAHCIREPDENIYPPDILPRCGNLARELRDEGYNDLRDVPINRLSNDKHIRVWKATKHNKVFHGKEAGEIIRKSPFPRYYLDFETIQPAIPAWTGTHPYAQIPFQWSCHIEDESGGIEHRAFLAEGKGDPRNQFAKSLIETLGMSGAIFVYHASFERTRMRELAEDFPEYRNDLLAATQRLVDLLPIAREHYYHPQMRGSWSIKAVLPTIAPELSYHNLDVGDGGEAQMAFDEILNADTTDERKMFLRNALLSYCERDTLAMLKLAHYFLEG